MNISQQQNNPSEFDSSNILLLLFKWKKTLSILAILAAISSLIISLLIEEKFQSSAIFFPANNKSLSKAILTEDAQAKNDISSFGEEEEAEAMLQILNSDEIKNKVFENFNLMEHYKINPKEKYAYTKLQKTWEKNVTFKRTEFNSIKVDVLDKDPILAANIANKIADLVDSTKNKMLRNRASEALKVIKKEYFQLLKYMKSLDDSLTKIRHKGVQEYDKQIEMITKVYYEAIAKNNTVGINKLEKKLKILAEYGSAYKSLTENLEFLRERLVLLKGKYDETKVDAIQNGSWKFIVNKATPAEKKTYPIRWLIVVVSVISTLIITLLFIIVIENYKKYVTHS